MIYSGKDRARELGFTKYRDMVANLASKSKLPWNGSVDENPDFAIRARIDYSRWLGDCPCGAANYVEPEDPIFYCSTCGNAFANGAAVIVIFPAEDDQRAIEAVLDEREIVGGISSGSQAMMTARPKYGMASRSWNPGETVDDLRKQYLIAKGEWPEEEVNNVV